MDTSRWDRIQDVYLEVSELEPLAREARLAELRATDPELAEEVRSLLEADGGDTLLDASVDELALLLGGDGADDDDLPDAPDYIGPWRVEGLLGRGGMGMVYRAVRDDGRWDRTVALKLIRGGATDPQARARFRREQRILASLEHPGIARLYDAGVSDDGLPWLAMELVEGDPIHRWCDARGLGIAERLRIFEKVCEAVEFAHRSLVIHRDLKPSNILVTEEGRVKLLDFGIARLVEADDDDDVDEPLTRAGQRVLTPGYSSPEQLRGERLTTASDVYTLGVVLHRLLTGVTPDPPTAADTEVTRPSAVVGSAAEDWPGWAPTDQVKRELRGDLDTLLMKALRTDPAERYASVADLREDLVRWQEQRPLSARPPTMGYRASRFVRRNRGAVGAGAVVAVVMIVAAGLLVRAEQRAQAEAARAELEAETANSVSDFVFDLLSVAGLEVSNGREVPVREVMDSAAVRLRTELDDAPVVRARLAGLIGQVYNQFGDHAYADSMVAFGRQVLAQEDLPDAALIDLLIAESYVAEALSDYRRAIAKADSARAIIDAGAPDPENLSLATEIIALSHGNLGEFDQASVAIRRAVAADSITMLEDGGARLGQTLSILGQLEGLRGNIDEAVRWLQEGLEWTSRSLGEDDIRSHEIRIALGTALVNAGRNEEAVVWSEQALDGTTATLGPGHPLTLSAQTLHALNLGRVGRVEEALPLAEEALRLRREQVDPGHPDIAYALNSAATLAQAVGNLDVAYDYFTEAHGIFQALVGDDNAATAAMIGRMGRVSLALGDSASAVRQLEASAIGFYNSEGPDPLNAATAFGELFDVLEARGETAEIERLQREYPLESDPGEGEGEG